MALVYLEAGFHQELLACTIWTRLHDRMARGGLVEQEWYRLWFGWCKDVVFHWNLDW
jgi:hypothetical protein